MNRGDISHSCSLGVKVLLTGRWSRRRMERHAREADELESKGYIVERDKHPNGAYFAVIGNHLPHEKEVGRIFAEHGFAFILEKEGNLKVRLPNGRQFTLPSCDGHIEGFTHEIYTLNGKPNPQTVAHGIKHSFKPFVFDSQRDVQADMAITYTPNSSMYKMSDIQNGVEEYLRQYLNGETKARPLVYFHVNQANREIYRWKLK